MRLLTKHPADLALGVQLVGGIIACTVQMRRLLHETEGISLAVYFCFLAYSLVCFFMLRRAQRIRSGRVTRNTMLLFGAMTVPYMLYIAVLMNGELYHWTRNDSLTIGVAIGGSLLAVVLGVCTHRSLNNPTIEAGIAIACKALPQLFQAYKILQEGNGGLAGFIVLTNNLAIAVRLGQVIWAWRESPGEYNRRAALVAEVVSALASLAVEAAWLTQW